MSQLPPAIFLMGPTASGKTALAIELAQHYPVELISVDSAMVYRGMDVGTAKPDAAELALAPHRLIDVRDPTDAYSAGDFCRDALEHMQQITDAGRIPLLVGGTMLYFHALEGLAELPQADAELRDRIETDAARQGWPAMHARLQTLDPASAQRIHPNDSARIQRALELAELTGRAPSAVYADAEHRTLPYDVLRLALLPASRADLHERIERRFHRMLDDGLIREAEWLFNDLQLDPDDTAARIVGYRQIGAWLRGECDRDEAVYRGIVATRQLAKRQYTWLRNRMAERIAGGVVDPLADDARERLFALIERFLAGNADS